MLILIFYFFESLASKIIGFDSKSVHSPDHKRSDQNLADSSAASWLGPCSKPLDSSAEAIHSCTAIAIVAGTAAA